MTEILGFGQSDVSKSHTNVNVSCSSTGWRRRDWGAASKVDREAIWAVHDALIVTMGSESLESPRQSIDHPGCLNVSYIAFSGASCPSDLVNPLVWLLGHDGPVR